MTRSALIKAEIEHMLRNKPDQDKPAFSGKSLWIEARLEELRLRIEADRKIREACSQAASEAIKRAQGIL